VKNNYHINQGHAYVRRNGRRIALHRVIVEEHLGRPLTSNEVVHHIDHDPLNNDIANLQVMTGAEHCIYHLRNMPTTPWTDEEEAEMLRLRREGLTIDVIAKLLGKGYYPVRRRLDRARKRGLL
jgi:HNH endonuclease